MLKEKGYLGYQAIELENVTELNKLLIQITEKNRDIVYEILIHDIKPIPNTNVGNITLNLKNTGSESLLNNKTTIDQLYTSENSKIEFNITSIKYLVILDYIIKD